MPISPPPFCVLLPIWTTPTSSLTSPHNLRVCIIMGIIASSLCGGRPSDPPPATMQQAKDHRGAVPPGGSTGQPVNPTPKGSSADSKESPAYSTQQPPEYTKYLNRGPYEVPDAVRNCTHERPAQHGNHVRLCNCVAWSHSRFQRLALRIDDMFDPAVIAAQRPCKNPFVVDPASWKPTTNQYSSPLYINVPSALVPHSVLNCTHKVDVAPWGGGRVESCHCQAWAESRKLRVVCGLDNPHDPEVLAGIGFSPNDKGEGTSLKEGGT